MVERISRDWMYAELGDYHRNLDPNWSYTPTYRSKMARVRDVLEAGGKEVKVLDAGCGEGVLVEEYRNKGFDIVGLDLNYQSDIVQRGDVRKMPFRDGCFDIVLLLDVFEHLAYADQPVVLAEINRVLRRHGQLIATIPNLAHWNSRFCMLILGRLDRTDCEINHVGERPYWENLNLLKEAGFSIEEVKGITLTVPGLYRRVVCRWPSRFLWLHDLFECFALPSLAMLDFFVCRKP